MEIFFKPAAKIKFDDLYEKDTARLVELLFYLRDKNKGPGLRSPFCQGIIYLLQRDIKYYSLLEKVPYYGSWRDLVVIAREYPASSNAIATLFVRQLQLDLKLMHSQKKVSTAAKWLPSPRGQAGKSELVMEVRRLLNFNEAELRRNYLSPLRYYLNLVEIKMSRGEWSEVKAEQIPLLAGKRYDQVLLRHGLKVRLTRPPPRNFVEIIRAVLGGNPLKADEYWNRRLGSITARNVAVVCDVSTPDITVPIALALAIGKAGVYSFSTPRVQTNLPIPTTTSLPSRIATLRGLPATDRVDLVGIMSDLTIVVTWRPPPVAIEAPDQTVLWWWPGADTNLQQRSSNFFELSGFSDKIFASLLNGQIPDLNKIMMRTLGHYKTCTTV